MNDRQNYYAARRAKSAEIAPNFPGGFGLVIPVAGLNGCTEVLLDNAARLLVEGSHRLPSQAERDAYHAAMSLNRSDSPVISGLDAARARYSALQAAGKGGRK